MSDKVIIEITQAELEVLRNLEAGMSLSGRVVAQALTSRERALVRNMVAQHPEPVEDGMYTYTTQDDVTMVAFVKSNQWANAFDTRTDTPLFSRAVDPEKVKNWTRIADLPVDEWL